MNVEQKFCAKQVDGRMLLLPKENHYALVERHELLKLIRETCDFPPGVDGIVADYSHPSIHDHSCSIITTTSTDVVVLYPPAGYCTELTTIVDVQNYFAYLGLNPKQYDFQVFCGQTDNY